MEDQEQVEENVTIARCNILRPVITDNRKQSYGFQDVIVAWLDTDTGPVAVLGSTKDHAIHALHRKKIGLVKKRMGI